MYYNNQSYSIANVDVSDLCKRYGTPLFVYDTQKIIDQYHSLVNSFSSSKLKIKYACKALSNVNILQVVKNLGAGIDTVSINEVRLALMAGFDPGEIIFTPNGVSMSEINEATEMGVVINIDNISILEQFGHQHGSKISVCIRLNPHIYAGGHHQIATGHIDSKFGISVYQMRHVERVIKSTNIKIIGLHMHTGSDILDIDVFLRGADILMSQAEHFKDLEFIDFGSGFKISYQQGDISTDIQLLGKRLQERFKAFCKEYGRDLELWFEPGKYLVSEAGTFFARVNVVKQTTATIFAGVDSGFNHLIRPMFYNAYHRIVNVSNPTGIERIYTVSGYICETDTFAWDRRINEIREGNILAFYNAGAYGFEMSSNYNSRFKPAEVMIHNGKDVLIRNRETMADLLKTQVLHDVVSV